MADKMNLKEAQEQNKLNQFIKEREKKIPPADKSRLDKALKSMTSEKSLEVPGTSDPGSSAS